MTDKQIEETLQRNAKNIGDGFDSEVLDYINRLKAENKRIQKNWDIAVNVQRAKWQKKVEQSRTETAKDILQRLLKWKSSVIFDTESVVIAERQFTESVKALAVEEYGVELTDEQ